MPMAKLPTGTVTFLFTDLEVSTRLWDQEPDAMRAALVRHDAILRDAVALHGGQVVKGRGDGVHAVFATADGAIGAAIDAQAAMGAESWAVSEPLRVRIGIHSGAAELRGGDYFGSAVNRAARLEAVANGGQIVCSQATADLVRDSLPASVEVVDLGEHTLRDLTRPEQIFMVVHPGLRREFPPLRSIGRVPGNLPVQVTSFLGREADSARIGAVMDQARVVTLTGVGGVGKTRLALHVAEQASASLRYPDGCWLCELAPVRDPELVPDAVIGALGAQPRPGVPVSESLLEYLRTRELLLVLDNCEHLLQPVVQLVSRMEQACPGVRIVATSREGLNVAGEWILAVSSLPVAEPGADVEAIASCDAVRLFVERARAARQDFGLDHTNADAIAQLCRRLDGIPLAIELAAARIVALSPSELAARLDDRFRVLGGGRRGAVERHQTLRAAVDWSYDLLDETEQRVLERLSVFAGGFTLHAAEAIASGDGIEAHTVLDVLAALVAQSLVVADRHGSETRYRLYETIRQYADEQLENRGDAEGVPDAHAHFFMQYMEDIAVARSADQDLQRWDDDLEREVDNLHAAFIWAIDTRNVDTALRMLASTRVTGMSPSDAAFRTGADTAVSLPTAAQHPKSPAALAAAAMYAHNRGDLELAADHCDEALGAEQRLGTEADWRIWSVRAFVAMAQGDVDGHIECRDRVVVMRRVHDDPAGLARALTAVAWARTFAGDPASAIGDAEEALALARRAGRPAVLDDVLVLTAHTLADTEPERALALLNEGIDLHATLGRTDDEWYAGIGGIAGHLAARLGYRRAALRYYAQAIRGFQRIGLVPVLAPLLRAAGDLLVPDNPETAAILHGGGDTTFPSPHRADEHREAIAALDATLGVTRRTELNDKGKAMGLDNAVALALDALDRAAGPHDPLDPIKLSS
jgi:predicted ATPase/class 3 adenylate cyclase/tetratricopeptide (TPR) repeat protein